MTERPTERGRRRACCRRRSRDGSSLAGPCVCSRCRCSSRSLRSPHAGTRCSTGRRPRSAYATSPAGTAVDRPGRPDRALRAGGGSHPGPISFYLLWPTWEFSARGVRHVRGQRRARLAAIGARRCGSRTGAAACASRSRSRSCSRCSCGRTARSCSRCRGTPTSRCCGGSSSCCAYGRCWVDDLAMLPIAVFADRSACRRTSRTSGWSAGSACSRWPRRVAPVRGRPRSQARSLALRPHRGRDLRRVVDPAGHRRDRQQPREPHDDPRLLLEPPDPPIGFREGIDVLLTQLNPARLFGARSSTTVRTRRRAARAGPSLLLLAGWIGRSSVAFRLRLRSLLRLDAVLGVALVLGVFSTGRGSSARSGSTCCCGRSRSSGSCCSRWAGRSSRSCAAGSPRRRDAPREGGHRGDGGPTVIVTAIFARRPASVDVMSPRLNAQLAALTPPTRRRARALARGRSAGAVLRVVAARAAGHRGRGIRPAQRAPARRVRREGRHQLPSGRDPLPRDP